MPFDTTVPFDITVAFDTTPHFKLTPQLFEAFCVVRFALVLPVGAPLGKLKIKMRFRLYSFC